MVVWSKFPILSGQLIQQKVESAPLAVDKARKRMHTNGLSGTITLADDSVNHSASLDSEGCDDKEDDRLVFEASHEIRSFCRQQWSGKDFRALAFFANPPKLQSVPEVRRSSQAESNSRAADQIVAATFPCHRASSCSVMRLPHCSTDKYTSQRSSACCIASCFQLEHD